jgi:hypothetical protein
MNIFVLSLLVKRCARYHCDVHVVKLLLESAQMLCTCHRVLDQNLNKKMDRKLYRSTHVKHPCNRWLRESVENYKWLYRLFIALCKEYTYRYNKVHLSEKKLAKVLKRVPKNIPRIPMTSRPLAMPEKYHVKNDDGSFNIVESYRLYYINEKKSLCKWTGRSVPKWFLAEKDR